MCCHAWPAAVTTTALSAFSLACLGFAICYEIQRGNLSDFNMRVYMSASVQVVLPLALAAGRTAAARLRWTAVGALLVLGAPVVVLLVQAPWYRTGESPALSAYCLLVMLLTLLSGSWADISARALCVPLETPSSPGRQTDGGQTDDALATERCGPSGLDSQEAVRRGHRGKLKDI